MAENTESLISGSDNQLERNKRSSNSSALVESTNDHSSQSKPEPPTKQIERKSFLAKQLENLEKELTFENINKRLTGIFGLACESQDGKPGESELDSRKNRLSSSMAAMFIVSATTGSAMRKLAYALKESSWFGVFITLLFCLNSLYAGLCIGWSWVIMEEQWPQYLKDTRIPYQDLGYRAVGTWMKYFVGISVDITVLSTGAVYIIMIAAEVEALAYRYIDFCPTIMLTSFILMPFMLLSSYKNMKFIAVFDVLASLLYCVLVIASLFLDKPDHERIAYTDPSYENVALAFGAISFAYGGGAIYPNIMADMTDRSEFTQSSGTAWLIVLVIYSLMPILGYAVYGDSTPEDIIQYILMDNELFGLGLTAGIVFILQIASTFAIALMPTMLSFEERLNCPDRFCLYRIIIRLLIMLVLMLLVLGLPFFPKFADFVGSTFINVLSFVFPPIFYVCLIYKRDSQFSKRKVSKKEILLVIEMILLGILIFIVSTYASLKEYIASPPNRMSCYLNFSSRISKELY